MNAPTTTQKIHRILVPTDFSQGAARAFVHALGIARKTGAEVLLLHVLNMLAGDTSWTPLRLSPEQSVLRERTGKIVYDLMESLIKEHEPGDVRVDTAARHGASPAPAIAAIAREQQVDLIVMGTHGRRGLRRLLLGSVAEEVVRTALCPVMLVREDSVSVGDVGRILVPVDFSLCSRQALPWAQALASAFGAKLVLLHILEEVPLAGLYGEYVNAVRGVTPEAIAWAKEELQRLAEELAASGVDVKSHVEVGYPPASIPDFARGEAVDLMVIASHGRHGLSRFLLGSVTEKVLRAAPCPMLIVRAAVEDVPLNRPAAALAEHAP